MSSQRRAEQAQKTGVVGVCHICEVSSNAVPSLHFARTARRLGMAARAAGLQVPAFRSPPRLTGVVRSIRRLAGGSIVAVRLHGRSVVDIERDMVDGVIAANQLTGEAAQRMRATLLTALADAMGEAAA